MKAFAWLLILTIMAPAWAQASDQVCVDNIPGKFSNRYTYNTDDTVTDRVTGLTWTRCPLGLVLNKNLCSDPGDLNYSWPDALKAAAAAKNLQVLGFRLPNIKELLSLAELHCVHPAVDETAFPTSLRAFWSSTPDTALYIADPATTDTRPSNPMIGNTSTLNYSMSRYTAAYYMDFSDGAPKRATIENDTGHTQIGVLLVKPRASANP